METNVLEIETREEAAQWKAQITQTVPSVPNQLKINLFVVLLIENNEKMNMSFFAFSF